MPDYKDKKPSRAPTNKERLIKNLGKKQEVHIKVAAQIVQHLSKGIYSNPANCIKELINNSFDADATQVIVRAKPEFDTFSITDNGEGMNYLDFDKKFLWISRSDKRDAGPFSKTGRPLIGKIGIGFISVSEICNSMTVISSKEGENFKFQAEIDFSKFKETTAKRKDFYELSEVKLVNLPEEKETHYTIILLKELNPDFKELLHDKDIHEAGIQVTTFDGLTFDQIVNAVEEKKLNLGKEIGAYWRLMLEVANTVPVSYINEGPIRAKNQKDRNKFKKQLLDIKDIKNDVKKLNFSVDFDGVFLQKPILLPTEKDILTGPKNFDIYTFNKTFSDFGDGSTLSFRGYVYGQKRQILPAQLRGIIIRIKNTAIGEPDPDFLGYPYAEKLFLPWVFGEVYVEDGLEEAMNINRNSFIITHPHYRKLRSFLHILLHTEVFKISRARSLERKEEAKQQQESKRKSKMQNYLSSTFNQKFSITFSKEPSEFPANLDINKKQLIIHTNHPILRKRRGKERAILEEIITLFEASYQHSRGDLKKMRKYFWDSLKNW
jgi:hypothetical protein